MDARWFAGRLRELREAAGWTQKHLAEQAGLSERAIAQWERGVREPGWGNVLTLCRTFGVNCDAFTQEPAQREPLRPGRPRKAEVPSKAAGKAKGQRLAGQAGREAGQKGKRSRKIQED